jgi:hypothetical protein
MRKDIFLLLLLVAINANAGIISKVVQEALEKTPQLLPNPSGKVVSKNLSTQDSNTTPESDNALIKKISAVSENIGKASSNLISILHTYHTPGQTNISHETYSDIKKRFLRQVSKSDREKLRLPLELHLTCTRYATEIFQEILASIKSSGSMTLSDQRILELRKCTSFFGSLKGFDKDQSDAFNMLADKLTSMRQENNQIKKPSQSTINMLEITVGSMVHMERSIRTDLGSWLGS